MYFSTVGSGDWKMLCIPPPQKKKKKVVVFLIEWETSVWTGKCALFVICGFITIYIYLYLYIFVRPIYKTLFSIFH